MRVLYVEDDPRDADLTMRQFSRSSPGDRVTVVTTIKQALDLLAVFQLDLAAGRERAFDLLLTDINLPDGDGLSLLLEVRRRDLPLAVVVLTGSGDEESVIAALRAGADDYVSKRNEYWTQLPISLNTVFEKFSAASSRRTRVLSVLYVEPNTQDVHLTLRAFSTSAPHIRIKHVSSAAEALACLPDSGPVMEWDVVLMDYQLPGMNAIEALKEIAQTRGLEIPVILITGHGTEEIALQAMRLGASDYLVKSSGYLNRLPSVVENAFYRMESQRERAALVKREREFHALADNLPDVVVRFSKDQQVLFANPALHALLGRPAGALIGRSVADLNLPADKPPKWLEVLKLVMDTGRVERLEMDYPCADGLHIFDAQMVPERNPDNEIESVLVIAHDVTERRRSELELRNREETFRLLIENASDSITVVNNQGLIRFQSPAAERMFGYTPAELTGTNAFEYLHEEDVEQVRKALAAAIDDPNKSSSAEFRFRHKTGTWRLMASVGRSIPGHAAEGYVVVNSRDVSERRKLEDQLRQAQKLEAIGQLSGGIAHDFNNVLTIIQGHVNLLQAEELLSQDARESMDEIGHAAERAANLTRQLLTFSRRQSIQPRDLDLNEVVTTTSRMLLRVLQESIQLDRRCYPTPLIVHADPGMMDQVLLNLVVNARDAMPKGGRLMIETAFVEFDEAICEQEPQASPGRFACLTVSDSGQGIQREVIPRLFEPFFTTKEYGKGTGLGLATVYGIVQQHGGWIKVYSEYGMGATFRIYLPLIEVGGLKENVEQASTPPPRGSERVLLVEDELALRTLIINVLTRLGYQVTPVASGKLALDEWDRSRGNFDLVLTDLVMPEGISGLDLGEQILRDDPDLKIVYMSGYSLEIMKDKQVELIQGVNFLQKPFSLIDLAKTVRGRLDG